jgi:hypothetical protein
MWSITVALQMVSGSTQWEQAPVAAQGVALLSFFVLSGAAILRALCMPASTLSAILFTPATHI